MVLGVPIFKDTWVNCKTGWGTLSNYYRLIKKHTLHNSVLISNVKASNKRFKKSR